MKGQYNAESGVMEPVSNCRVVPEVARKVGILLSSSGPNAELENPQAKPGLGGVRPSLPVSSFTLLVGRGSAEYVGTIHLAIKG